MITIVKGHLTTTMTVSPAPSGTDIVTLPWALAVFSFLLPRGEHTGTRLADAIDTYCTHDKARFASVLLRMVDAIPHGLGDDSCAIENGPWCKT